MPNITPAEVAVVFAAIALFFVGPAVLAWSEARQRRAALLARQVAEATSQVETAVIPAATGDALNATLPEPDKESVASFESVASPEAPPFAEPTRQEAAQPSVVLQPLVGESRYHFQLGDLHQTQLPDWPPAAIRNDPERSRSWQAAEQLSEDQRAAINSATIWSPYPARSSCLGAADITGSLCHLRFLLFPVLWPVSQNQAVAQAVFEVDRDRGEVRGWVDALRLQELTDDNRRAIREAGGDA